MATLPSFRTWVTGEIVTAAEMNSNIRDSGNFWLSVPVFEGRQTVAQSIPNNASAAVNLDTNDIDTDNGHSTTTNPSRYTGKTAGRFQASGGIGYATNATGTRHAEIWKNGAATNGGGTNAMAITTAGISHRQATRTMTFFLNGSTDYLELFAFQLSGAPLNTAVAGIDDSTLSVRWVGTT